AAPRPTPVPPVPPSATPPADPPSPGPKPTRTGLSVRAYRGPEGRERPDGPSLVMLTLLITAPAVLAAAALRPRSRR
ncbi:hypothetical protein ACSNOD_00440, partial [Streptomyces sp. URMC 123]